MNRIKILHINSWDTLGGAAVLARRLQLESIGLGHQSWLLTGYGNSTGNDSSRAVVSGWPRWKKFLRRLTLALEYFSGLQYLLIWWSRDLINHPWTRSADIVHLHNLHGGYISHRVLPKLSSRKPVVWTLHDMWAMTGHCGYSFECQRWQTGCGECPHLDTSPALKRDSTRFLWKAKQRIYSKSKITIVTPSKWLADAVGQSPLLSQFPVHHIPNGVDLTQYQMVPKLNARERLGLPQNLALALFIAEYLDEPRKGGHLLVEAMRNLDPSYLEKFGLVTVGLGADRLPWPRSLTRFDLGFVKDAELLPAIYSAADVTVVPSVVDNLPNTVLEAMACGTPVVASRVGGIPEMVNHMDTGYLAKPDDPTDLANGIKLLLEDQNLRHSMGKRGRQRVEEEYSLELQAQRYAELYRQVLAAEDIAASPKE